jgi:AAA+ ATPase superfamily predicted ATPase
MDFSEYKKMKEKTKLIGREKETASIDKLMHSGRAEFLAVYGRRRVGKTFLIRQYLKNNMVFDFTGTKDGAKEQQLINFFEEYTKRAGNRKKKQVPLTSHEAF